MDYCYFLGVPDNRKTVIGQAFTTRFPMRFMAHWKSSNMPFNP
jgi:hypothetical protein